jgi:uncharacterized coiled-coil protein SlyX
MQDPLEDLQMRWAHQELAIEALNETVAHQDQQIAALRQELVQLKQLLLELKPSPLGADAAAEPPPPHY